MRLPTAPGLPAAADLLCAAVLPVAADLLADLSCLAVVSAVFVSRIFRNRSLRRGDMVLCRERGV